MRNRSLLMTGFMALALVTPSLHAQTGDAYRIFGNSIRVDLSSHWNNWIFQNDRVSSLNVPVSQSALFQIDTGGMRPIFFRRKINAALESEQFIYKDLVRASGDLVEGGASALSNDALASGLIDGDLSTYWEPATPASFEASRIAPQDFSLEGLRNWELMIDLGRLVYADSITVVFPAGQFEEEFLGEPVKSFALLASMGERFPFPLGTGLQFTLVGQLSTAGFSADKPLVLNQDDEIRLASTPGSEGRYVQATFYPVPLSRADWDEDGQPDIKGTFLQYIKLKVTDSDLWRDFRLGAGEEGRLAYEALPPERQGAKVYQRIMAGGLLAELRDDEGGLTARDKYEQLSPEKQGPILYFGKEVPRVAEIQVWAKGDNYALHPEQRAGGAFEDGGLGTPDLATDGLYDSEWQANTWSPLYEKGTAWWDLGATFWVDNMYVVNKRVGVYSNLQGAFTGPNILVSDGTLLNPLRMEQLDDFPQLEEGLKWDDIIPEEHIDNRDARVQMFKESFPMRKIRFLQVRDIDISGQWSGRYGYVATPAEIQLYGEGYPVSVWAYSPPIALTDARGNFIRKTLPRIAWEGDVVLHETDPITGQPVERIEPLDLHADVRLQIQTRTSDQTDTNFTYYEVVEIEGAEERSEITQEAYDQLVLDWLAWEIWQTLPDDKKHESRVDDDGDGVADEDPLDRIDNDGDGLIDEDGKKLRRAPRTSPERDGELAFVGWSEWSNSYAPTDGRTEATITSPNPRKFLQVRVNIQSEDPFKTARIRSLRIDLAPPLALELAGELALLSDVGQQRPVPELAVTAEDYQPPVDIDPLEPQSFSYFIRAAGPDPGDADVRQGFDEVLIVTTRPAQLRGVRLGQVQIRRSPSPIDPTATLTTALSTRFDVSFERGADGQFRDADGRVMDVVPTGTDSLYLRLPGSVNQGLPSDTHALLEVQFASQSFREGVEFASYIRDSRNAESVFQRVDTDRKDATELVDSRTARVSLLPLSGQLIQDVSLTRVVTPNGDGINDVLRVGFTLLKVLEERPVSVVFYDLQGRRVGEGVSVSGTSASGDAAKVGEVVYEWDGRDGSGGMVPPGIYLCRIEVEADEGDSQVLRPVYVAY